MIRLMVWLALGSGALWLGRRLWPAIRSEPSTWLGEDWQQEMKKRLAV